MIRNFAFSLLLLLTSCFVMNSSTCGAAWQLDGDDGAPGDPGSDGTDAEDGASVDKQVDPEDTYVAYAYGKRGGFGGDGGEGVDGPDPDMTAAGGNGGQGGRGGDARISADFLIRRLGAVGGHGGSGGRFGFGTTQALNGMGGDGGDGGNAVVEFFRDDQQFFFNEFFVFGGDGGSAFGPQAAGGNGGTAKIRMNTPNGYTNYRGSLFGGSGGNGYLGANGGTGASTLIGYSPDSTLNGKSLGTFKIWGGNGGSSENGMAGRGGTARFHLSVIQNPDAILGTNVDLQVNGGAGGKGIATGTQQVSGQMGAVGVIDAGDTILNKTGRVNLNVRGGNGGSALGRNNRGHGAHGSAALFRGTATIDNQDSSWPIETTLFLTGGDGGHAQGTGRAGNGGTVVLSQDPFEIKTVGKADVFIEATGGRGGWGRWNGNGGVSFVSVNNVVDDVDPNQDMAPGRARVVVRANGGHSGAGLNPINAAYGGHASARATQYSNRPTSVLAMANAGAGNMGRSGTADARAQGEYFPTNEGFGGVINVEAVAQGAKFGAGGFKAAHGSQATADATAVSYASDSFAVLANAKAFGGWGFSRSGAAIANAEARKLETAVSSTVYATAESHALGDTYADDAEFDGYHSNLSSATSVARSSSAAVASSRASGVGLTDYVIARAITEAPIGSATALATSEMLSWRHHVALETKADYVSLAGDSTRQTATSRFEIRGSEIDLESPLHVPNVYSALMIAPEGDWAQQELQGSMAEIFGTSANRDLMGFGKLGAATTEAEVDGQLTAQHNLKFDYQVLDFQNDENLIFGLFKSPIPMESEAASVTDGFSEFELTVSVNQRLILSESFTSVSDANDFFSDLYFDLGAMPGDREMLSFDIRSTMLLDQPSTGFGLGFAFGNGTVPMSFGSPSFSAVPEPGTATILGLAILVGSLRRCKH